MEVSNRIQFILFLLVTATIHFQIVIKHEQQSGLFKFRNMKTVMKLRIDHKQGNFFL